MCRDIISTFRSIRGDLVQCGTNTIVERAVHRSHSLIATFPILQSQLSFLWLSKDLVSLLFPSILLREVTGPRSVCVSPVTPPVFRRWSTRTSSRTVSLPYGFRPGSFGSSPTSCLAWLPTLQKWVTRWPQHHAHESHAKSSLILDLCMLIVLRSLLEITRLPAVL